MLCAVVDVVSGQHLWCLLNQPACRLVLNTGNFCINIFFVKDFTFQSIAVYLYAVESVSLCIISNLSICFGLC